MAVRVWNKPRTGLGDIGSTHVDYPDAADYTIGTGYELNLRDAVGQLLATYPPGNWHHVEMKTETPSPE